MVQEHDDARAGAALDGDLAMLERKLASLIAHTKALRAANEALRRELTAAQLRNRALDERMGEARERIDALIARLPEATS